MKPLFQKSDGKILTLSLSNTCATDLLRKVDRNTSDNVEGIEIALANIYTMKVVYNCV